MNWKLKTLAFWGMEFCPGSNLAYDFLQKKVTGRYKRKYLPIDNSGKLFLQNISLHKNFKRFLLKKD